MCEQNVASLLARLGRWGANRNTCQNIHQHWKLSKSVVEWTGFVGAKHGHGLCCDGDGGGAAPSSSPVHSSTPSSLPLRRARPFPSFGPLFPLEWCLVSLILLLLLFTACNCGCNKMKYVNFMLFFIGKCCNLEKLLCKSASGFY